jgi:rhamnose transport system permease protein
VTGHSSSSPARRIRRWPDIRVMLGRWETVLVVLLIVFVWLGTASSKYFLSGSNFSFMADDQSELAIMSLPMALLIITGEIDLSAESMLGLASCIVGLLWSLGLPLAVGICVALLVGAAGGLFNGLLVTRVGLPSLVVTIGTMALYRGLAYVVLGSNAISNFPAWFTNLGFGTVPSTLIPWPMVLLFVLVLAFGIVLHGTRIGRQIYAIGLNQEAARYSGIRVARAKTVLFVLSGLLSALAGVVMTARLSSARADNGTGLVLSVVTAVLLGGVDINGGRGTIVGVVLALFILGVLQNALSLANVPVETQSVAVGLLLAFSVVVPNLLRSARLPWGRRHVGQHEVSD